jgi:DNA-binding MarR family transcriptional regulator
MSRLATRTNPEATPAALPDVLQFMQRLWAVVHGVARTSKRMKQDLGVTGPQRLVLRVVGLHPGMSAGELAVVLHIHPSTLTGVLQRLIAQRLLMRVEDARDRRRAVLRLTPRGKRVNVVAPGTVESAIAQALEEVTDRDRRATTRVLAHLAAHLGGSWSENSGSTGTPVRIASTADGRGTRRHV